MYVAGPLLVNLHRGLTIALVNNDSTGGGGSTHQGHNPAREERGPLQKPC